MQVHFAGPGPGFVLITIHHIGALLFREQTCYRGIAGSARPGLQIFSGRAWGWLFGARRLAACPRLVGVGHPEGFLSEYPIRFDFFLSDDL